MYAVNRPLIRFLATLVLAAVAAPLCAQSLADVAKKEEARRRAIAAPAPLLTNKDLGAVPPAPPPSTSAATTPAPGADASKDADKDKAGKDAQPAKDQAYWSGRMKDLQAQLDRDQTYADALQSRINALTTDFVNRADPAQQAVIEQDRRKAIAELGRLTQAIQKNKKAVVDLQEEARRAGVPPGWLR
jgi:hypothetical protein